MLFLTVPVESSQFQSCHLHQHSLWTFYRTHLQIGKVRINLHEIKLLNIMKHKNMKHVPMHHPSN